MSLTGSSKHVNAYLYPQSPTKPKDALRHVRRVRCERMPPLTRTLISTFQHLVSTVNTMSSVTIRQNIKSNMVYTVDGGDVDDPLLNPCSSYSPLPSYSLQCNSPNSPLSVSSVHSLHQLPSSHHSQRLMRAVQTLSARLRMLAWD